MTDTILGAVPEADDDSDSTALTYPTAVRQDLPSERLDRLAELAAAALELAPPTDGAAPVLSERALADVWAAVDASTATATKTAYRSDWSRFTMWTTERGFAPLPAPPLVVAHYVTEAAAEQTWGSGGTPRPR